VGPIPKMTATVATTSNALRGAAMFVSVACGEFLPQDDHCLCTGVGAWTTPALKMPDVERSECACAPCMFHSDPLLGRDGAHGLRQLIKYGYTRHESRRFQIESLVAVAAPSAQTQTALLDDPLEYTRFLSFPN
jgi:hypothetical protein